MELVHIAAQFLALGAFKCSKSTTSFEFLRSYTTTAGTAPNMAALLETGQQLLWTIYDSAKATPLPILLSILLATAVSTLAFVSPSATPSQLAI